MSLTSKLGVGQRQGDCWDLLASHPSWEKIKEGDGGMTGQAKAPAAKSEDLNWISGPHVVEGENWVTSSPLAVASWYPPPT